MAHGITNVKIGGQERTICFNNHSLIYLGKQLSCDPANVMSKVSEIGDENPLRLLTFVIYAGLMGFMEREAIYVHDITMKNVAKWVSEADSEEFTSVWDTFSDAIGMPKATPEQVEAYEKKKKSALKK